MKNAYFAGGCFWCIAAPYYDIKGVKEVISGFSGGEEINPSYEDVKHQLTSHRETINIVYDDNLITYQELLDIFFNHIDPFDNKGQFIDKGYSYTLAIYYLDEIEKELAISKIKELKEKTNKEIYISVEPFKSFYKAEEYHQNYAIKNKEAFEKELIESGRKK